MCMCVPPSPNAVSCPPPARRPLPWGGGCPTISTAPSPLRLCGVTGRRASPPGIPQNPRGGPPELCWGDGVGSDPPSGRAGGWCPPPIMGSPHSFPCRCGESGGAGRWGIPMSPPCPLCVSPPPGQVAWGYVGVCPPPPLTPPSLSSPQGEGLHQLREALKILAERVLILETMIGLYGE